MTTRRIKSESIENLKRVVEVKDDNVGIVGDMGVVMADAYAESIKNENHVEEVKDELEKKTDDIKTENPGTGKEVKNEFTAKLVLDESLEDFELEHESSARVNDADMFDTYWDMDMFDFIYELVADSDRNRLPIPPLGYQHSRFQTGFRDVYKPKAVLDKAQYKGMTPSARNAAILDNIQNTISAPQVGSGGNFIDIYSLYVTSYEDPITGETVQVSDPDWRFREMMKICELYKFDYKGPEDTYKRKRSPWSFNKADEFLNWDRVMRIYVPCDDSGYPLGIEEYFSTIGLTLDDVMPPEFCAKYRKCETRIKKEAAEFLAKKERERNKTRKTAQQASLDTLKAELFEQASKLPQTEIKDDEGVISLVRTAIDKMFDLVYDKSSGFYDVELTGEASAEGKKLITSTKSFVRLALQTYHIPFSSKFINSEFDAELA